MTFRERKNFFMVKEREPRSLLLNTSKKVYNPGCLLHHQDKTSIWRLEELRDLLRNAGGNRVLELVCIRPEVVVHICFKLCVQRLHVGGLKYAMVGIFTTWWEYFTTWWEYLQHGNWQTLQIKTLIYGESVSCYILFSTPLKWP